MDFPQPIIDSVYRKSCDGDSRSAGNASESRGWWEPGASNAGLNITPELQFRSCPAAAGRISDIQMIIK